MKEKNFMFNGLYKIQGINPSSIEFSKEENGVVGSYSFENIEFIFVELQAGEDKKFNIYVNNLDFNINFNKKINKDEKNFINKIIENTKEIAGIDVEYKLLNSNTKVNFNIKGYIPYKNIINNPEYIIEPIIETSLAAYAMIMSNFIKKE